jgi:histidinol-phosphate aminotransferase
VILRKKHLREIDRIRIPEDRNLSEGLRLNRNERVENWGGALLVEIFSGQPDWFLSTYPDSSLLYEKLCKRIGVDESQILITSGIDGAIKTLFEIVTKPGDQVGVPGPTYAMYYVYSKIFGTELCEIPYKPDTLKLDRIFLQKFIATKPAILFLPNPNQPIEDTLTHGEIADLAYSTRKNNTLLVVDEAYFLFGAETAIDLIDEFDNLVVMRTFSKGFGVPAIRLGYMVSNEENMRTLAKTRFAHESNSLINAVGEYLLDNYSLVEKYVAKVIEGREYVKQELESLGIRCNGETGNYLLIDLTSTDRCRQIVSLLEEKLIYVKGNFKEPWGRYMLITVGPKHLMELFVGTMKEVVANGA